MTSSGVEVLTKRREESFDQTTRKKINLEFEKNFQAIFNTPKLTQKYLNQRSDIFDELIIDEFLKRKLENDFAIVALGGYGRRELYPLLILTYQ